MVLDVKEKLGVEDCRLLQHMYQELMTDLPLIVSVANSRQMKIAEVYVECKIMTQLLGDRIKALEQR